MKDILAKDIPCEELLKEEHALAFKAYIEGIVKDVAEMRVSLGSEPQEVLISGKLAFFKHALRDKLGRELEEVKGFASVKHAA